MKRRISRVSVVALMVGVMAEGGAWAQTTYNNTNAGSWSVAGNWQTSQPPSGGGSNVSVVIMTAAGARNQDHGNPFTLNRLTFNIGATLSGNPLRFQANSGVDPLLIGTSVSTNATDVVLDASLTVSNNALTISGQMSGSGDLIRASDYYYYRTTLSGDNSGLSGRTVMRGGELYLDYTNNAAAKISSAGDLVFDVLPNADTAQLRLLRNGNAAGVTQNVGAVQLVSGQAQVTHIHGTGAGLTTELRGASLSRSPGALLWLNTPTLGSDDAANGNTRFTFTTAPTALAIGGGFDNAATMTKTNLSIFPFMVAANYLDEGTPRANDFVTWDTSRGLRRVTAYAPYDAVGANNVRVSSTLTGQSGKTINSLKMGSAVSLSGSGTLTIQSGAIVQDSSASSVDTVSGFDKIELGNGEGVVHRGTGVGNLKLMSPISVVGDPQRLTIGGPGGWLTLGADNTYTGETVVARGSLRVGDGGTTGTLGKGPVRFPAGVSSDFLDFNRSNTYVVSNDFYSVPRGDGRAGDVIRHVGTGTLELRGNIQEFQLRVTNGTLRLAGGAKLNTTWAFTADQTFADGSNAVLEVRGSGTVFRSLGSPIVRNKARVIVSDGATATNNWTVGAANLGGANLEISGGARPTSSFSLGGGGQRQLHCGDQRRGHVGERPHQFWWQRWDKQLGDRLRWRAVDRDGQ